MTSACRTRSGCSARSPHLDPPEASAVLAAVLDGPQDEHGRLDATPSQLRAAVKKAIHVLDPDAAGKRHEAARRTSGAVMRPQPDGMADVVLRGTAIQGATILAALRGRAAAMTFDDDLTEGQKQIAALLHALGCDRVSVQAVIECPVERAVDLRAAAGAAVWSVDVRMPVAVALGLSDHPAMLAGYGPIGADQARALLPQADLVKACVDATTGEVLTADPPVRRARPGARATPTRPARSDSASSTWPRSGGTVEDLSTDDYVPGTALARLVDLRDVTSVFPGDLTPTSRTHRDHRIPWPRGRTDEVNLQNASEHWHRAKHNGWTTTLLHDGTVRWTSPGGGTYDRRPQRTVPPPITRDTLPPPDEPTAREHGQECGTSWLRDGTRQRRGQRRLGPSGSVTWCRRASGRVVGASDSRTASGCPAARARGSSPSRSCCCSPSSRTPSRSRGGAGWRGPSSASRSVSAWSCCGGPTRRASTPEVSASAAAQEVQSAAGRRGLDDDQPAAAGSGRLPAGGAPEAGVDQGPGPASPAGLVAGHGRELAASATSAPTTRLPPGRTSQPRRASCAPAPPATQGGVHPARSSPAQDSVAGAPLRCGGDRRAGRPALLVGDGDPKPRPGLEQGASTRTTPPPRASTSSASSR